MWWAAAIQGGIALFSAMGQKAAGGKALRIGELNAEAEAKESGERIVSAAD